MVIINYEDEHGIVHIQSLSGARYWHEHPQVLCHYQDVNGENPLTETRKSPTCKHCIDHIKYAVIIAKNSEFPTDTD